MAYLKGGDLEAFDIQPNTKGDQPWESILGKFPG